MRRRDPAGRSAPDPAEDSNPDPAGRRARREISPPSVISFTAPSGPIDRRARNGPFALRDIGA